MAQPSAPDHRPYISSTPSTQRNRCHPQVRGLSARGCNGHIERFCFDALQVDACKGVAQIRLAQDAVAHLLLLLALLRDRLGQLLFADPDEVRQRALAIPLQTRDLALVPSEDAAEHRVHHGARRSNEGVGKRSEGSLGGLVFRRRLRVPRRFPLLALLPPRQQPVEANVVQQVIGDEATLLRLRFRASGLSFKAARVSFNVLQALFPVLTPIKIAHLGLRVVQQLDDGDSDARGANLFVLEEVMGAGLPDDRGAPPVFRRLLGSRVFHGPEHFDSSAQEVPSHVTFREKCNTKTKIIFSSLPLGVRCDTVGTLVSVSRATHQGPYPSEWGGKKREDATYMGCKMSCSSASVRARLDGGVSGSDRVS
eukprot:scaffold1352_cov261-Pinguiococcus_pyrenoidosus.AAC.7